MVVLKGQLHVHTTYSDGTLKPQEAADIYARLGYDFIAFTDHDHLLKPSYHSAIEKINTNLIIFKGIELTIPTRWGYVHVNQIQGDQEVIYIFNHPADYGLSIKQTLECIKEVDLKYRIDVVEVTHLGFYTPFYDSSEIPYPKIATDDSHVGFGCGRTWIEIECRRDKDEILRHIKRGWFKYGFIKGDGGKITIA